MLIEMKGEKYNCRLVRRAIDEYGKQYISDNRNVKLCEKLANCATCMHNINYSMKRMKNLSLQPLTKQELADLKSRQKFYPIKIKKGTTIRCYKPIARRSV